DKRHAAAEPAPRAMPASRARRSESSPPARSRGTGGRIPGSGRDGPRAPSSLQGRAPSADARRATGKRRRTSSSFSLDGADRPYTLLFLEVPREARSRPVQARAQSRLVDLRNSGDVAELVALGAEQQEHLLRRVEPRPRTHERGFGLRLSGEILRIRRIGAGLGVRLETGAGYDR